MATSIYFGRNKLNAHIQRLNNDSRNIFFPSDDRMNRVCKWGNERPVVKTVTRRSQQLIIWKWKSIGSYVLSFTCAPALAVISINIVTCLYRFVPIRQQQRRKIECSDEDKCKANEMKEKSVDLFFDLLAILIELWEMAWFFVSSASHITYSLLHILLRFSFNSLCV